MPSRLIAPAEQGAFRARHPSSLAANDEEPMTAIVAADAVQAARAM